MQNGYNTGRDNTLTILVNNAPLRFPGMTAFRSRQETTEQTITKIDGVTDRLRYFTGWTGSFSLERQSGVLDDYFNQLEANFYLGITDLPVFIDSVILNPNGGLSSYQYTRVLLKLDDAGEWSGNSNVKQSMSFMASRRIPV